MKYDLSLEEQAALLADWRALCAFLEAQPYNACYEPRGRGAYLPTGPRPARKTVTTTEEWENPPHPRARKVVYIPNPAYAEELARARRCRMIIAERRRMGLVFWSSGYGWRLRKDYRESLAQEQARLDLAALKEADHA